MNAAGVGRNDRVAIVLPNGPEMATCFLACAGAAASGTLIATPDAEGTTMIASRYQARYKRVLSEQAANGYDAVAIAVRRAPAPLLRGA